MIKIKPDTEQKEGRLGPACPLAPGKGGCGALLHSWVLKTEKGTGQFLRRGHTVKTLQGLTSPWQVLQFCCAPSSFNSLRSLPSWYFHRNPTVTQGPAGQSQGREVPQPRGAEATSPSRHNRGNKCDHRRRGHRAEWRRELQLDLPVSPADHVVGPRGPAVRFLLALAPHSQRPL